MSLKHTVEGRKKLASCVGKVPFPSMNAAVTAKKRMKSRSLKIYRCGFCHHYHLAHDDD